MQCIHQQMIRYIIMIYGNIITVLLLLFKCMNMLFRVLIRLRPTGFKSE